MIASILSRMSGEELLLLRILNGDSVRPAVDAELDRRGRFGPQGPAGSEDFWAGRTYAERHSARLAA